MASLKDIQFKIGAVKKTRQITKAMNMVAASRLRGAQSKMEAFRPYAAKFAEVLGSLAARSAGEEVNPLLVAREKVKHVHIVLCTSDRGLCGGFNTNLISAAEKFMAARAGREASFSFTNFGRRGRNWARTNKFRIDSEHIGVVGGAIGFHVAQRSGQALVKGFLEGTYDEVHLIYAEFLGMGKQPPAVRQLLPIPPIEAGEDSADESAGYLPEHICEPSAEELLGEMLPRNVYVQLFSALLETSTSEHAARMMAMDNATKACKDMIENLTLIYNKARQAAITAELMDIVGGAEALKG